MRSRRAAFSPSECLFSNLFEPTGLIVVRESRRRGRVIIGLGKKVQAALRRERIGHVELIHPAARGKMRRRAVYIQHVKAQLYPHVTVPCLLCGQPGLLGTRRCDRCYELEHRIEMDPSLARKILERVEAENLARAGVV